MSEEKLPTELRYTKSHEWVKVDGDLVTIGITDHAQSELTDIVFVDLPKVGKPTHAGDPVLVLESVKTVADVYAPSDGAVAEVNSALTAHPELVNQDPYGRGWLVKIRTSAPFDASTLLTADGYRATLGTA